MSTLEELEAQKIITPVTQPTQWISSIVVIPKKNGKLHLCLDPQDLYKAIQRERCPVQLKRLQHDYMEQSYSQP